MKLASLKTGGRDGSLIVVSRDLKRHVSAADISPTLQVALDDWQQAAPRLNARYVELNQGTCGDIRELDVHALAAPLPRAFEFVDGSAYLPHVERVRKARGAEVPESFNTDPLLYPATSAGFLVPAIRCLLSARSTVSISSQKSLLLRMMYPWLLKLKRRIVTYN